MRRPAQYTRVNALMTADLQESPYNTAQKIVRLLPALSGIAILVTNPWFTIVDDECAIVDAAFNPVRVTLSAFAQANGQHHHPPLSDIFLHYWLLLTHANLSLLRLPFPLFYVLGAYALGLAAKRLGGVSCELWVLGIVALWPYGFHYARVAAWYSFCFAAVSLLTLAYLRFMESRTRSNWIWLVVAILALVYSNYFGWVLVGFLALDSFLKYRDKLSKWWLSFTATAAAILILYLPIIRVFFVLIHKQGVFHVSPVSSAAFGAYTLYCTFVSESVGPWFWYLGIPACVAIGACLLLTLRLSPWTVKWFFLYYLAAFGTLVIAHIEEAKHIVLVGPWLILSIGVTIGTIGSGKGRNALILSMLVPGLIGWIGIVDRHLYAAPHWVEPWGEVAQESAAVVRNGGIVLGINPSFFCYLTYDLPADNPPGSGKIWGILPNTVRHSNVFTPEQWLQEGRPMAHNLLVVNGMHFDIPDEPSRQAENLIESACMLKSDRRLVYDAGAKWKRKFAPEMGERDWRVEVRSYSCP